MNLIKTISAAVVGLSLAAATTQATVIAPTGSVNPVTGEVDPSLTGTLQGSLSVNFSFGNQIGTLLSQVYSGSAANPFVGGLTFVYTVTEAGPNTALGHIATLGLNGFFAPLLVDVAFVAPTTGVIPITADWNPDTINFHFSAPNIMAGQSSDRLVVNTSSHVFGQARANVIDGDIAPTFDLAPVPEPTTMIAGALLLLPFGASTLRILRRNRTA
ncbi:MAG: hypothetical protein QOJ40_2265 [Verrucomicrobiota bacterium]